MSEEELYALPKLVPENQRNACPDLDCNYVTIDTMMLLSHMDHLHPEFNHNYQCPHCPRPEVNKQLTTGSSASVDRKSAATNVPFEDVEFHLRCHGDLLFKCCHCSYYHWQKRMFTYLFTYLFRFCQLFIDILHYRNCRKTCSGIASWC